MLSDNNGSWISMKNRLNSMMASSNAFFKRNVLFGFFFIALFLYALPSLALFVFSPYLVVPYLVMISLVSMELSPNKKDKPSHVSKNRLRKLALYGISLSGMLKKYFTAALTSITAHLARNKWFYNPLLESLTMLVAFILIEVIAAMGASLIVSLIASPMIIAAIFFPAYLDVVFIGWFCSLYAILAVVLPIMMMPGIRDFIQGFNIGKGKTYEFALNCFFCFVIGLLIAVFMMSPILMFTLVAPAIFIPFDIAFGAIVAVCLVVAVLWPILPDSNHMKQRAGSIIVYASHLCQRAGLEIIKLCAMAGELCVELKGFMQEVFLTLKDLFQSVVMRKEEGKIFTQYKPLSSEGFSGLSPEGKIKDRISRAKTRLANTNIFNVSDRKFYRESIATLE